MWGTWGEGGESGGEGGASGETTTGPNLNFDQTRVKHDNINVLCHQNLGPAIWNFSVD